jgi:hypothetical protein
MPTFMCFLNWTDQGAKNAKDASVIKLLAAWPKNWAESCSAPM